jgi:hypothetical protein
VSTAAHPRPQPDGTGPGTDRSCRAARLSAPAALAATLVTGCDQVTNSTGHSSAAPPTIVCGTILNDTPAGAGVIDAVHDHRPITSPSSGGVLFIRVSDDCLHGADVAWAPAPAAVLVKRAPARDGLDAAVVLRPATRTAAFTVTARRGGAVVTYVPVQLTVRSGLG